MLNNPAIHVYCLAIHPSGIRTDKECHRVSNILRLTESLQRRHFSQMFDLFVCLVFQKKVGCGRSERISNAKKKGVGNKKNGNKYLSWAYVEAANFCIRHNPQAEKFYQRKKAKSNGIVAIKALSNKLARASYYMMRDQVPFDSQMLFA
jgi:hypothetical protein